MRNNSFIIVFIVLSLIAGVLTSCAANTDAESHSSVEVPETSSVSDTQSISSETPSHELSVPAAESEAEEEGSVSALLGISVIDDETKEHAVVVEGNAVFVTEETLCGVADISSEGDRNTLLITTPTGIKVIDKSGNELFDASRYSTLVKGAYGSDDYIAGLRYSPEKYVIDRNGKVIAGPYAALAPALAPDVYYCSNEYNGVYDIIAVINGQAFEGVYTFNEEIIRSYAPALDSALAAFSAKIKDDSASAFEELWGKSRYEAAEKALSGLADHPVPEDLDGAEKDAYIMRELAEKASGVWSFYEADDLVVCENYATSFIASAGGIEITVTAIYHDGTFTVADITD